MVKLSIAILALVVYTIILLDRVDKVDIALALVILKMLAYVLLDQTLIAYVLLIYAFLI